jgi:HSP20 family protein
MPEIGVRTDDIAKLAYHFWEESGHADGHDLEHWFKAEASCFGPSVDVIETDKAFEIKAEVPGLDEKNVEVKLTNGGLTIRGAKEEERNERNKGYRLHERRFGSFERYVPVPESVDADKIEAAFEKGVLTVTLPKSDQAQSSERRISVRSS